MALKRGFCSVGFVVVFFKIKTNTKLLHALGNDKKDQEWAVPSQGVADISANAHV